MAFTLNDITAEFLTEFLRAKPTMLPIGKDLTTVNCGIHQMVECGDVKGGGCAARRPGKHPAIQALYEGKRHACLEQEGVRQLDAKLLSVVFSPHCDAMEFEKPGSLQREYSQGAVLQVSDFGAFYCYQEGIVATGRMRAGRLLAPGPYAVDVLRLLRVLGRAEMKRLDVRVVNGALHVVPLKEAKGIDPLGGRKFVLDLVNAIDRLGPEVRIGADFEAEDTKVEMRRMAQIAMGYSLEQIEAFEIDGHVTGPPANSFEDELRQFGFWKDEDEEVEIVSGFVDSGYAHGSEDLVDATLAITPPQVTEVSATLVERQHALAVTGDAALKYSAALVSVAARETPAQASARVQDLSAQRLLEHSSGGWPMNRLLEWTDAAPDRTRATAVKRVVGCAAINVGVPAVLRVFDDFGIKGKQPIGLRPADAVSMGDGRFLGVPELVYPPGFLQEAAPRARTLLAMLKPLDVVVGEVALQDFAVACTPTFAMPNGWSEGRRHRRALASLGTHAQAYAASLLCAQKLAMADYDGLVKAASVDGLATQLKSKRWFVEAIDAAPDLVNSVHAECGRAMLGCAALYGGMRAVFPLLRAFGYRQYVSPPTHRDAVRQFDGPVNFAEVAARVRDGGGPKRRRVDGWD